MNTDSVKSFGITQAVTKLAMEPNRIALSPSTIIRLPTIKVQVSTQSSKGAYRTGPTFKLLSSKKPQETNQEGL